MRKEPEHDLSALASAERLSSGLAKDNDMIDIGQVSRGMHAGGSVLPAYGVLIN